MDEDAGARHKAEKDALEAAEAIDRRIRDRRTARVPKIECPYCSHAESRVVNSRPASRVDGVFRRRECLACHQRYTTSEILIGKYPKAS